MWAKTKSNKNWLKHTQKGWHSCGNSTWKRNIKPDRDEQYYRNPYKYDPFNGNNEAKSRFKEKLDKVTVWCDDCNDAYYLRYPCVHHLTDNPRDKERHTRYMYSLKDRSEPEHKQKGL